MEDIERFRLSRTIKFLESLKGAGTSLVTLVLPPGEQISRASQMLAEEHGTASNIKSRVNRQAVLTAISSVQQRVRTYRQVPETGIVFLGGEVELPDGRQRVVVYDIVPPLPISKKIYACDSSFHIECLSELLTSSDVFGFIILDGSSALFATLSGNTKKILHNFDVSLPKKHGRGGQSALRFERLRKEKRHNYLRKVAEAAASCFVEENICKIKGFVLAGSAEFKSKLLESDMLHKSIKEKVVGVFDVPYGGRQGLSHAIELSSDVLQGVGYTREKEILSSFFSEISRDGMYCFGIRDTLQALDIGAVETLIVCEETNELHEGELFVDWIAENYGEFGCQLEMVSPNTTESQQLLKGFGGIGGILRYSVEFQQSEEEEDGEFF
ncbi:eukaryotic peptide chain release translation termination factor 1 [Marseillevirus marseillevirus]|uniref:Eukaryotic peptide chain release translation termination factor 1 n=1 Tax=Marseillevirus marseillevirus TaxID=694581 RepID=D2XAD5_GBMV|nr:eukaryotic peptide chain release translation termination factor 1 [Marseillevirus marseillevirus]ADB03912.1 eukaryotic peptide chain release translation termination factor 1 [Marseillevirus marseillevirus]